MRAKPAGGALVEDLGVFFADAGDFVSWPVYDRRRLYAGHVVAGPAVVEQFDSTTLIHPGQRADVDDLGFLLIQT